jgi:ammonia channel protein AmtB
MPRDGDIFLGAWAGACPGMLMGLVWTTPVGSLVSFFGALLGAVIGIAFVFWRTIRA